jgi:chaperonin GroEL (HSP60 family)
MAKINRAGPGYGFDVTTGQVVEVMQAGICDPAATVKAATFGAVAGAALALTIDVLIHRQEQPQQATIATPGKRKRL